MISFSSDKVVLAKIMSSRKWISQTDKKVLTFSGMSGTVCRQYSLTGNRFIIGGGVMVCFRWMNLSQNASWSKKGRRFCVLIPNRRWEIYIVSSSLLIISECVSGLRFIENAARLCWGGGSLGKLQTHKNIFHNLPKIASTTAANGAMVHLSLRGTQFNTQKKAFILMTDCYQVWVRGTMAAFICHLKDPFNVALWVWWNPDFNNQICGDWRLCRTPPLDTDVIEREGGSSEWKGNNGFSS